MAAEDEEEISSKHRSALSCPCCSAPELPYPPPSFFYEAGGGLIPLARFHTTAVIDTIPPLYESLLDVDFGDVYGIFYTVQYNERGWRTAGA